MANFSASKFTEMEKTSTFWKSHPDVPVKDLTPEKLAADVATLREANKQIEDLEREKSELDAKRDRLYTALREPVERVRKAAIAHFGPDAPELRSLGLTPKSERKPPVRKPKKEKTGG